MTYTQSLDAIHFEVKRRDVNERISLRSVCIRLKHLQNERLERNGYEFKAVKARNGVIEITVTSRRTEQARFQHTQAQYNPDEVYVRPEFTNLSQTQRATLRQFYESCNPRPMSDLVRGDGRGDVPELDIGTTQFHCTAEDLLSGLIETIYAMRNALLHGEANPDPEVLSCYEPAYRIVMQFLACI